MLTDEDREEIRAICREENKKLFSSQILPLDTDLNEAVFTSGVYAGPASTNAKSMQVTTITNEG